MLPLLLAGLAHSGGRFLLDLDDNLFDSTEPTNGNTTTGTLTVNTDGSIAWTGDAGGTNETGHTWWYPVGLPKGTWHVKLSYSSGTNQYASGSGLGSWLALSAQRTWTFSKATSGSGGGSTSGVYLLEFSNDGGSTTYDSVSINDITLTEESV